MERQQASNENLQSAVYMDEWIASVLTPQALNTDTFTADIPQNISIGRGLVKLVINLCDELEYSPEIEFTCLETLDNYWAGYARQIISEHAVDVNLATTGFTAFAIPSGVNTATYLWNKRLDQVRRDALLKLISVLMLSAKFIGKDGKRQKNFKLSQWVELMASAQQPAPSPDDIRRSEEEVSKSLGYHFRSSLVYGAMKAFIFMGKLQLNEAQIEVADLERLTELLLRVVFLERSRIGVEAKARGCLDDANNLTGVHTSVVVGVGCNMLAAAVVLCGLIMAGQPFEFYEQYGITMTKKAKSVERLDLKKIDMLVNIIYAVMQLDAGDALRSNNKVAML